MAIMDDMVTRFLSWRLPKDFFPDGGITFTPPGFPGQWPTGTNLFHCEQTRAMLRQVTQPLQDRHDEKCAEVAHLHAIIKSHLAETQRVREAHEKLVVAMNRKWWQLW